MSQDDPNIQFVNWLIGNLCGDVNRLMADVRNLKIQNQQLERSPMEAKYTIFVIVVYALNFQAKHDEEVAGPNKDVETMKFKFMCVVFCCIVSMIYMA